MSIVGVRRPRAVVAAAVTAAALLAGCDGAGSAPTPTSLVTQPSMTLEYSPGLSADVYLPDGKGQVPLVVLVPGGGWTTADPAGLAGLAAALADAGIAAAPVRVRAGADGATYPEPVEDVLCAVAAAVDGMRTGDLTAGPIVVLGHSSGAHLAALAVLAFDDYSPDCGAAIVAPDALVGLSGPYDISEIPELATALLGVAPDEDPGVWARANPLERADLRPDVPVLLLHGDEDVSVPLAFTEDFAEALEQAGHATTVQVVPDADHDRIYRADVGAARVAQWVRGLPG